MSDAVLGEIRERDVLRLSLGESFDALAECGHTEVTLGSGVELEAQVDVSR